MTFRALSASPMPGAAGYLRALERAGARIVYLTGRPESSRSSTRKVLRALGVPRGPRHRLVMNRLPPDRPIVDSKKAARAEILRVGTPVAFFDNDLANVRLFRHQYPGAQVVRVAGHSGSSDPEPQLGLDDVETAVREVRASLVGAGLLLKPGDARLAIEDDDAVHAIRRAFAREHAVASVR